MARAPKATGSSMLLKALNTARPAVAAAMAQAVKEVAKDATKPRRGSAPTTEQLVAVIRQYQHANGPDRLAEADAAAVALIGEAPLESFVPPKRKRAQVDRS